eukprot:743130_1
MFASIGNALFGPSAATIRKRKEAEQRAERERNARREAEERAAARAHELKMEQQRLEAEKMKNKKQQVDYWRKEQKAAKADYDKEVAAGEKIVEEKKAAEVDEVTKAAAVDKQKDLYETALKAIQEEVDKAQAEYKENHDKIRAAIDKTNVGEGSIPQFLNLINSGLIVGTLNDTAKREELNAKLAAFGELIARRVQTTMLLDTYFIDGMAPLIPFLNEEQYKTMDSILCDDEKEFNEIVVIIEKGIANTNAENKAYNEGLAAKKEEEKVKRTKFAADIEANDNQIAGLQKTIGELKVKQMDVQLMVQMEEMRQLRVKQKTMKDEIKDIDKFLKAGPRKDIKPIRIKPKKGGPLFEELKKLCMLDFAESEKGWITKLEDDVELCEIPLSKYFKGKLAKWAEYLEEDCYESMEEILCDDDDEFDAIVATIEEGIARDGGKPMQQATPGSTTRVMRDLERLCMRDHAKVGWLRAQAQKEAIVGKQLSEISPFLATFFGEMQVAVTDARIILEYSAERTPAQQLAIKNAEENEKKLKAIEDEQDVERYGLNDELKAIEDEQDVERKLPDQFAQNPYGLNDEQAF